MIVLSTGGVRFIGGNFVFGLRKQFSELVVNLEECTYAGNLEDLVSPQSDAFQVFVQEDISDGWLIDQLLRRYQPHSVPHLRSQSDVDSLIVGLADFIRASIVSTSGLLQAVRTHWAGLTSETKTAFRVLSRLPDANSPR